MSRHPEQDRALAYFRRKGRDAAATQVRARVASTLANLESALAGIDESAARLKPDADTWCVQEVVNHLTVSLERGIEQLHALIDGDPPGAAIPASLVEDDALQVSWQEAVERLADSHARNLAAIDRAIACQPTPERTVPAVFLIKVDDGSGELVPLEWIEHLDWKSFALLAHVHTLEHLDQIARIRARTAPA